MGREIGVGLRINPAAQLMGSQMRMGGTVGQFGMDQEDLKEAVEKTLSYPQLTLRGIHIYTATQVFDADALLEHCRNIFEVALEAADHAGRPLEMIDFGGGFGVPYFEKMEEFDLERFGAGFRDLLLRLPLRPAPRRLPLYLRAGPLPDRRRGPLRHPRGGREGHARQDLRRHRRRHEPPPDRHRQHGPGLPQSLSPAQPEPSRRGAQGEEGTAVAGPCCTPLDMFGTNIPLAEPVPGDLIGVFYSGAYGFSASNRGFLSHPEPAEVLVWQGEAHLLRPPGKPEDVLNNQSAVL